MPYKKKKSKRRTTRKRMYTPTNQALKVAETGIKATTGLAALGITTAALTNIAKS